MTTSVMAQEGGAQGSDEPAPAPVLSPYRQLIAEGIGQAASRNLEAAEATLTRATRSNPGDAPAFMHLASVQRIRGNLVDAFNSFRTCANVAEGRDDTSYARCLQGTAEVLERREGALSDAAQAWERLAVFLQRYPVLGSAEMARARKAVIERVQAQEAAYVAVRERIAARERESNQGQNQRQGR